MAQSKLKSRRITIDIGEVTGNINFPDNLTLFDLMAASVILEHVMDNNFTAEQQARARVKVYERIENVEEII